MFRERASRRGGDAMMPFKYLPKHDLREIQAVKLELTTEEKNRMIDALYAAYYNTDQDTQTFAAEFYYVVGMIQDGLVPYYLVYLVDFQELLADIREAYRSAVEKEIVKEKRPVVITTNEKEMYEVRPKGIDLVIARFTKLMDAQNWAFERRLVSTYQSRNN
jgi:hypothetical protein